MERGLRAPLSPREEIALRRVANGSDDIGPRQALRLVQLDLVRRDRARLSLTATGQRRLTGLDAARDQDRS